MPPLQPGDVLLYGGTDLVARLIQFRTWSDTCHVEVYADADNGRTVTSRFGTGVKLYPFNPNGLVKVLRPFPPFDRVKALNWFYVRANGRPYGWGDIVGFYGLRRTGRGLICSQTSDLFLRAGGVVAFSPEYPAGLICPRDFETSPVLNCIWKA